jgi:large subunit ribosomal protein L21
MKGKDMEAYAVLATGGKQYRVAAGDTLEIESLDAEAGTDIELDTVLAVSDGKELTIGMPFVKGAKVVLTIMGHKRGEKVINFKKKRRKGYARKIGHRQELTKVTVKSVA